MPNITYVLPTITYFQFKIKKKKHKKVENCSDITILKILFGQGGQENQGDHGWHHCDQIIQNILLCNACTHQTNQVDIEAPDFKKLIDESHSDAVNDGWCNCQSHSFH